MNQTIYPIGIQNFEKIRKDGYLYIDKTALIYQLVTTGRYYFLSRPRRFGKSLLLSTLEAYFQGKKELFEGLAMEKLEKDWIRYPILHLDLNAERYSDPGALESILRRYLNLWEDLWGKDEREITPSDRFTGVIRRAYERTGRRVVILVDEYDKPLLQAIGNPELQETYRSILKAFYGVLKSMDGYIRLAFLTGTLRGDMRHHRERDPYLSGRRVEGTGRHARYDLRGNQPKTQGSLRRLPFRGELHRYV